MAANIKKIAELMGAEIVGKIPHVGGGPFGAARLAYLYQRRQQMLREQEAAMGDLCIFEIYLKAPTAKKLVEIAERMSTPEHMISASEVAALIVEDAVAHYEDTE